MKEDGGDENERERERERATQCLVYRLVDCWVGSINWLVSRLVSQSAAWLFRSFFVYLQVR